MGAREQGTGVAADGRPSPRLYRPVTRTEIQTSLKRLEETLLLRSRDAIAAACGVFAEIVLRHAMREVPDDEREAAIALRLKGRGGSPTLGTFVGALVALQEVKKEPLISKEHFDALKRVQPWRNGVAHPREEPPPTLDEVMRHVRVHLRPMAVDLGIVTNAQLVEFRDEAVRAHQGVLGHRKLGLPHFVWGWVDRAGSRRTLERLPLACWG